MDVIPVTEAVITLDEKCIGSLDGELVEFEPEVRLQMGKKVRYLV